MSAIAAVDTALWDIKGKALNVPVYQCWRRFPRTAVQSLALDVPERGVNGGNRHSW